VTTFNLDEYLGLPADHPSSFRAFMQEHLFDGLDLDPARCFFPECPGGPKESAAVAKEYEAAIADAGGIDLQLLGIGRNGHVAFNEPGSARDSRTRSVELSESTRRANAPDFPEGESVPRAALTMGIATILEARRLRVLAFGAHKAEIIHRLLEGTIGPEVPATFLREHGDVELWIDREAAAELGG
jgi:glucosamine-6-phosphate deaminase